MKQTIFILIFIVTSTYLTAQEFTIAKINEIAYAQDNTNSESIQVIDDYLYYSSSNGLEIYEINVDGSITKISLLALAGSGSMIISNQYCFIVSGGYDSQIIIPNYFPTIFKIDISDIYNPIIVNQIEYPELNHYNSMNKFGNYLIFKWFDVEGFHHDFYSLPELEFIGQVNTETQHKIINDNLLVRQDGLIFYIKQYVPPSEYEVIGVIDVSAYSDGNYTYDHFKVRNDTILTAVNSKNITFWNISNPSNWQYLSRYTLPENTFLSGNKQYAIINENAVIFDPYLLRLLNISDILNPILVDSIGHNMELWGQACDYYGNNIYVGTLNNGIQHYKIENYTVEYVDSYYEYITLGIGDVYDNKIITTYYDGGYYLFNVEDPLNPIVMGEWFDEKEYLMIHKQGGFMVLKDFEEYAIEIYNITDLENPTLRNTLSLNNYGYPWTFCIIDESDPNSFYLCNFLNNMFWKFDISESGEPVQLFEYELPSTPCDGGIAVINSIAYVTYGEDIYNLLVIDGLDENEPFIANEIYNFTVNKYLDNQDGYLIANVPYHSSIAQIFQLEDPLQPELHFTPQWGECIEIEDDLIFSKLQYIVSVYENRPNSTDPVAVFNGLNYIYNINLLEHEGTNYLITNENANIGLFEYTYSPSSINNELPKAEISLSNYPNPFNPETNIVFNLPEECEVKLEIYNIKGQRVKYIPVILSEVQHCIEGDGNNSYSVIWNGTDKNNDPVASGIYMYQLKVDGKAIASKKCLLLK
ncbi:MAG: T9SS type A sorting domain-containing protein [Candidatus Cloacimonetes bacterium]|nr:T9SS type A sorting domain-containing protein [Candidatus Cloacimonadota bacterium]